MTINLTDYSHPSSLSRIRLLADIDIEDLSDSRPEASPTLCRSLSIKNDEGGVL